MSDLDKLKEMVAGYPKQISDLESQITSIDNLITDVDDQVSAIENEVMAPMLSASNVYLADKTLELGGILCTYGSYGVSNLTEWAIIALPGPCPVSWPPPPVPPTVILWDSSSVTPSGTPEEVEQYYRQQDFPEAYGHIHDPIDASITYGTYGLLANKGNLQTGKSVVQKNKAKIETIFPIYEQFTT